MPKSQIIAQFDGYVLTSHGNGWAYTLADTMHRQSVFVQDDDAAQFRAELGAYERAHPHSSALPSLWADYAHVAMGY